MANLVGTKDTLDKSLGLLINGVELYSPSVLNESIYFGPISSVEILNQGKNYDVITPSNIEILDLEGYGEGAKVYGNMKGILTDVLVLSPGIGYDRKPTLNLVGGNLKGGVKLETNLIKKVVTSSFVPNSFGVSTNTISFIGNHNFENGEEVIYKTNSFPPVGGLVSNSSYFVGVVDSNTISLYRNASNALNKINVIDNLATVVGINTGIQEFSSRTVKNVIDKVYINEFDGEIYNKIVKISARENTEINNLNGVNILKNYIYAKNHNLNEKDLIVYNNIESSITGLSSTNQYYVTLLDKDRFKLSDAGESDIPNDYNYKNNIYVDFNNDVGVGTHTFSYPPIKITVSSISGTSFNVPPILKPIVLGSFDSVFIEDFGVGYGVSEVINLNKNPITEISGTSISSSNFSDDAVLQPIIVEGKIVDVQILNSGGNYQDNIDIVVDGEGKYAKLYPIISNGKIVNVIVISTGAGYLSGKTRLMVKKRGVGAKFLSNVTKWTINQYFKNKIIIDSQDNNGYIIPSRNVKNSLQFINLFPSKELRDSIKDSPSELKSSPILGWAYDGNPILGPYIYSNQVVGVVTSGYDLKTSVETSSQELKRPPSSLFPNGYFIEDYEYIPNKSQLDEHNGMFITDRKELFPEGTYAYFMTIDSNGNPVYPYVIGETFKNEPNIKNYNPSYNQNINFTNESFIKNTNPLYLTSPTSGYEYLQYVQEKYKQDIIITNTLKSNIDEIKILNPGKNYKVDDKLVFKVEDSQDLLPSARISRLEGKNISNVEVGITTYSDVVFKNQNNKIIGITSIPNIIEDLNYISISNGTNALLNGDKRVSVRNKITNLESDLNSGNLTAYIKVNDISDFYVDDYIQIDEEIAKLIEIYPQQSKFFIYRLSNLGVHTSGVSLVKLLPNRFEFTDTKIKSELSKYNNHYFNPKFSVGIGTTETIVVNQNTNSRYTIPKQTIYIPNHQFTSNQILTYSIVGAGVSGILVSDNESGINAYRLINGQSLYAVNFGRDYLGISTVGYGASALYFKESSYPLDEIHSLKYIDNYVTGDVEISTLSIDTTDNHELLTGDSIKLSGKKDEWEYYAIKFDLNHNYKIKNQSDKSFNINLLTKPQFITYAQENGLPQIPLVPANITYTTDSNNARGSIFRVELISSNNYYNTIPIIEYIQSDEGVNATLLAYSKTIGKINSVERIKDGFDYPSDVTLQPKLSTNTICYLDNINKVGKVNVLFGGTNYNSPPTLKVIGDDSIVLSAKLKNSTVVEVSVDATSNNLSVPLEIIPINNSNGFDILNVYSNTSETNRIELDINQFPLIYKDYAEPIVDFPFEVSDLIFIENCRIEELNKVNYNSTYTSNAYFKVVGVNTSMGYIEYLTPNTDPYAFGTYNVLDGYGTVVNKNRLAKFEMILEKNSYLNGETVKVLADNNNKFYGEVMESNGWDINRNQLRLTKTRGELNKDDILIGSKSLLKGKVLYSNSFTMKASLGPTREKINNINKNIEDLNSDLKKIQDSNYYQDFSYSIKGTTPYETWKEPVKSIIHPSGFKEFSNLQIISKPLNIIKLKTTDSILEFNIEIENESSFYTRNNYTIGYEDERINQTTVERVYLGSGNQLWPVAGYGNTYVKGKELLPYLINKSNKVIPIKDISSEFRGTYDSISFGQYNVEFNSNNPYYLGVSTSGLSIGDIIGYSTYHEYPYNTKILSVGINSVRTLYPHKVYSGSITESLEFKRILNQNTLVGISSFTLIADDNSPIYKVVGVSTNINVSESAIELRHNFESGQIIHYENVGGSPIGIVSTTDVIGGISTNLMPPIVYGIKVSENKFQVSGLPSSQKLRFTTFGSGVHKFTFNSPNASTLITIDDIIQTPIHYRGMTINITGTVGIGTSILYTSSSISSLSSIDILKIENEYLKIISVGIASSNSIEVERGFLGTIAASHNGINTASVYRGNYLINEDVIYFTSPPFGPSGLPGIEVSSKFNGRAFSRSFNSTRPNDRNLILDDISNEFTEISSFILKENGNDIVGLYTNTNGPNSININNNPLILINNISQISNIDYMITTPDQNHIEFLSGVPNSGKILRFEANQGYGYLPLVGAAATVLVSSAGTISRVYLNGPGSGYRGAPKINIYSPTGNGAVIEANIGTSGTITNLSIINPGTGYTSTYTPEIFIDLPLPYYNLNLSYQSGNSGVGTNAKVSVIVGSSSSIQNVEIIESGQNYKVGDVLNVVGLTTIIGLGTAFKPFTLTVKEVFSDTFTGIYPGQFLQFDDISSRFNSVRKVFDITTTIDGVRTKLTFKSDNGKDYVENNFFIFINDVLQKPKVAYNYVGGRIIFTEPPIQGSKSNILYYQGSIDDTEIIVPVQSIKEGDTIKFEPSDLSKLVSEQNERIIKRLVSSNSLDTFPYSDIGISSNIARPISWTKQKNDRLINGSLISKSRKEQESKIYPTSKLIWNVSTTDTSIYVDNAYPLFIELDNGNGGITEEKRNAKIVKEYNFTPISAVANVSGTSTISSVSVSNIGNGYYYTPKVSISKPQSGVKDPLYNWSTTSGISTVSDFNSLVQGDVIIGVGNNNLVAISTNLTDWYFDSLMYGTNINLKKIGVSTQNNYISVGSTGKIFSKLNKDSPWKICGVKTESFSGSIPQIFQGLVDSQYSGTFNDVIYNEYLNCWITVGDGGKIYQGVGIGTTTFIECISQIFNYKSVDYNSKVMIAVGYSGISSSTDGKTWYRVARVPSNQYNFVKWFGDKFIITSNSGIYTLDSSGNDCNLISGSPTILNKILQYDSVYIGIGFSGDVYHSFNLLEWELRTIPGSNKIKEIKNINLNYSNHLGAVGTSGTVIYSTPSINKAELECNVSGDNVSSINIINGGFGYFPGSTPSVLVESPKSQSETLYTINAVGDFGKIVGIKTSNTGIGTISPSISFELRTDYSSSGYESLNTLGITYSQLSIGDYFLITNSNVTTATGYALTGITTYLGGMGNYPKSRVGTAVSFLDGVYKVEYVQTANVPQGIVTVTCHVVPVNGRIGINTIGVTTTYYGNYSWSKLNNYENRATKNPLSFEIETNNGLVGLSTAHTIQRIPPLSF
jgi:hypothetical protein